MSKVLGQLDLSIILQIVTLEVLILSLRQVLTAERLGAAVYLIVVTIIKRYLYKKAPIIIPLSFVTIPYLINC